MGWLGQENWNQQQGGYGPPAGQNPYPLPGQAPPPGQSPPGPVSPPPGPSFPPSPGFPPPKGGSGAGPVLAIVGTVLLVVIVGLVTAGYFLVKKGAEEADRLAQGIRTLSPPALPAPPVPSGPSTGSGSGPGSTTAPPSVPPRIAGWHGVPSMNHGLAYDVPSSWEVLSTSTIVGFEDESGRPAVGMSGAAGVERGSCTLVRTGVSGGSGVDVKSPPDIPDLTEKSRGVATRWANAGYTPKNGSAPTVRLSPARAIDISGTKGVHVTAEITVNGTRGKCDPPRAVVHTVVMQSTGGAPVAFIAFADRDVPSAIDDQDLQKILTTLRRI